MASLWTRIDWTASWTAAQAIIALGALWFLAVQVTRDGRARRAKDLAVLTAAHQAVRTARKSLELYAKSLGGEHDEVELAQANLRVGAVPRMTQELMAISLAELPDPYSVSLTLHARGSLGHVVAELGAIVDERRRRDDFPADVLETLGMIEAALGRHIEVLGGKPLTGDAAFVREHGQAIGSVTAARKGAPKA